MTLADSFQRLVEERDAALAEVERLRGALERIADLPADYAGSSAAELARDALEGR